MRPGSRRAAAWGAIVLALVVRGSWLAEKPFWRDEAWVAVLVGEPLDEILTGPRKTIPFGFVVATKCAARLPLPAEVAYRLVPFGAGLGALVVLAALARRLGGGRVVPAVTLWIGAGLPAFVYYSRELKPYSLDLLFSALLPLLVLKTLHRRACRPSSWAALYLTLGAAPWLSFGAAFPIAATLAGASAMWWRRAGTTSRRRWCLATGLWAASFAAVYLVALDVQSGSPRALESWKEEMTFIRGVPLWQGVTRGMGSYVAISSSYLFPGVWPLVLALAAVGLWTWPRRGRWLLVGLYLGTAAVTVAAALAGRYVLSHGRLLLFAAPVTIILAGAGLVRLGRRLRHGAGPWLALAAAMSFSLYWSAAAMLHRLRPYRDDPARYFLFDVLHDVEPLIAKAELLAAPHEPVFVSRYAGEAFRFYSRGRLPGAVVCTRVNCLNEGPPLRAWLRSVERRGWMLLLAAEDRPGRRQLVRSWGCDLRVEETARGALLWRVERRLPP
jgi:hypothetical protein